MLRYTSMIFGFNSEVERGGRVYHVQSEVRAGEDLLQTQIFVQGRCVAKRELSYADRLLEADFSEEAMHEQLRVQHRHIVESVREGALSELAELEEAPPQPVSPPPAPARGAGVEIVAEADPLQLQFVSSSRPEPETIQLSFRLTRSGRPAAGLSVMARLVPLEGAVESFHSLDAATSLSAVNGVAELKLAVPPAAHGEAMLIAQVIEQNRRVVKRFRLRAARR